MNTLVYEEVVHYNPPTTRELLEKAKANEFKTEEVLREILREEAQAKGEIPEGIPYYERIGFLGEYCRKQLLDVVDHLAEQPNELTMLATKL